MHGDAANAINPVPRHRSRRMLGITALLIAGLLLVYLLLSWFAFEPMLRWALPRFASEHAGHQLSFRQARFDPWRLRAQMQGLELRRRDGQPLLQIEGLDVDLDAASPFKRTWLIERLQLTAPVVHLSLQADGRPNWMDLIDSFAAAPTPANAPAAAPPRLKLQQLIVQRGQLALADRSNGRDMRVRVDPLDLEVADLSTLPDERGDLRLNASLVGGGTLNWRGRLGLNPLAATGEWDLQALDLQRLWPYLTPYLAMAPPQGRASLKLAYDFSEHDSQLSLLLDHIDLQFQGVALRGDAAQQPAIALEHLALKGGRLDLSKHEGSIAGIEIGPGRIALNRDASGQIDLANWLRTGPATAPVTVAVSAPVGAVAPQPVWRLAVDKLQVQGIALDLSDQSRAAALRAQAAQLQVGLSLRAEVGAAEPSVEIEQGTARLDGLTLSSAGLPQPWFSMQAIELTGGSFSSSQRRATLGAVTLSGGLLRAERDEKGRLPLVDALQPGAAAATSAPPAAGATAKAAPPWHFSVDHMQARDFAVALREASVTPATQIDLIDLKADLKGLSEDMQRAVPVTLDFRIKSGGRFQASGKLVPGAPSADLQLALDGLSLLPLQPYVAQATTLVLKRGVVASKGRLRWQANGWRYDGALDLGPLLVDEMADGDRFLSWQRLHTPLLNVTPKGLHIAELNADGLGSKLTIFKDKTLNVAKVMKTPPAPAAVPAPAPASASASASAPVRASDATAPPFGVDIERIRIQPGTLDFADLSLALPFGTRIHDLSAQLVGLKNSGDVPARLELDGKVDEFGLARAAGQLRVFDPTAFTDVKVEFRNVEMANLTPYSATFAGRRITSGKLSLDLEYKLDKRQLAGENKIVMDKLTLGERVESPTAANLPLDLAVAILQDSDGRIDLGLPVSGSLDDPQFSYGQIVWKAIVNVLTKIVTAPFRALGALFGGSERKLDSIGFDAGSAVLLPPEREKLMLLSQAMAKRPGLAVTVQAGYDADADAAALRQSAVRRAVALLSGRSLAPDEDPGPIVTTQPSSQRALEQLFVNRFGAPALAELRQKVAAAKAAALAASQPPSGPSPALSSDAGADADGGLHARLLQGLVDAEVIDEPRLQSLAAARGRAVADELAARAVPPARVRIEPAARQTAKDGAVVTVLGLAVAGSAAATAAPDAASAPGGAR